MVDQEDLDRIRNDYDVGDGALTLDDVQADLEAAGFEDNSIEPLRDAIGGEANVAVSEEALNRAQTQAIESLSDGGAIGGEIVRADDGFTAIGAPQNVEQRIERTGPNSGDVIARNKNTGTEGRIGTVELAPPPDLDS